MYSTEINGENTEFGTSGMLYRSNKLMYDRATETLWHQFLGEPVVGPLAGSGIRLKVLPNVLTTWGEWLAQHPDTTVISNDTGVYPAGSYRPEWDMNSIYFSYRADPGTMFPVAGIDDRLPVKEQVFGLAFDGVARAYSRTSLFQTPVLNDTVGGRDVVIVSVQGAAFAPTTAPASLSRVAPADSASRTLKGGCGGLWKTRWRTSAIPLNAWNACRRGTPTGSVGWPSTRIRNSTPLDSTLNQRTGLASQGSRRIPISAFLAYNMDGKIGYDFGGHICPETHRR